MSEKMDKQGFLDYAYQEIQKLRDSLTIKEISENFPVIITLGDQSSGKSSIFSRIIGKKLPIKDGCCTRVPIMISTRRTQGELTISTTLTNGRNFYDPIEDNFSDAIELAQTNCLDGDDFSTNMVKITIYNQPYDLTFIDLPGLTARDHRNLDNQQNKVYDIFENIKNNYKKSIIFHVIDANTEFEKSFSILELNDIIRGDKERQIITIYTKTDKLENDNKFIELDKNIKGEKFIMSGKEDLREKQPYGFNYLIGKDNILRYLAQINENNIKQNFKLFMNKINQIDNELDKKLKNELRPFEEIRERNKIIKDTKKILDKCWNQYKTIYKKSKETLFNELKKLRAFGKYTDIEITNFKELRPGNIIYYWDNLQEIKIKTSVVENSQSDGYIKFYKKYYDGCEDDGCEDDDNDSDCSSMLSNTTDEFFDNMKPKPDELYTYYYTPEKYLNNEERFCRLICRTCFYDDYNKTKDLKYCVKWCNENGKHSEEKIKCTCNISKKDCRLKYINNNTGKFWLNLPDRNVINEIKTILAESGELQPDIMKDHTQVVLHFLEQFASKCKEKMGEFLFELDNMLKNFFLNEITNPEIKSVVEEIFYYIKKEVEKEIKKLYMKNSIYNLISTPNSHYFSENILRAIGRFDTLAEDDGYYKIANCKVEAFVKVQSKYIIERTDEIFNFNYYHMIKQMIDNFNDYDMLEFDSIENEILNPLEKINSIQVVDDMERETLREKALNDKNILSDIILASKQVC